MSEGADPRRVTKSRSTALHAAAFGGHLEVVKLLLAAGARTDRRDGNSYLPKQLAEIRGNTEIANVL